MFPLVIFFFFEEIINGEFKIIEFPLGTFDSLGNFT